MRTKLVCANGATLRMRNSICIGRVLELQLFQYLSIPKLHAHFNFNKYHGYSRKSSGLHCKRLRASSTLRGDLASTNRVSGMRIKTHAVTEFEYSVHVYMVKCRVCYRSVTRYRVQYRSTVSGYDSYGCGLWRRCRRYTNKIIISAVQ